MTTSKSIWCDHAIVWKNVKNLNSELHVNRHRTVESVLINQITEEFNVLNRDSSQDNYDIFDCFNFKKRQAFFEKLLAFGDLSRRTKILVLFIHINALQRINFFCTRS